MEDAENAPNIPHRAPDLTQSDQALLRNAALAVLSAKAHAYDLQNDLKAAEQEIADALTQQRSLLAALATQHGFTIDAGHGARVTEEGKFVEI